jgi:hypothetical protein
MGIKCSTTSTMLVTIIARYFLCMSRPYLSKNTLLPQSAHAWPTLADALLTASSDYDEYKVKTIKDLLGAYSADSIADATVL